MKYSSIFCVAASLCIASTIAAESTKHIQHDVTTPENDIATALQTPLQDDHRGSIEKVVANSIWNALEDEMKQRAECNIKSRIEHDSVSGVTRYISWCDKKNVFQMNMEQVKHVDQLPSHPHVMMKHSMENADNEDAMLGDESLSLWRHMITPVYVMDAWDSLEWMLLPVRIWMLITMLGLWWYTIVCWKSNDEEEEEYYSEDSSSSEEEC